MKYLCVFCGSSSGDDPRHLAVASAFGEALVKNGIGLVFGGSRMGLMGRLAHTVLEAGGSVTGVIPGVLMNREVPFQEITELRVVKSMHERKTTMAEVADGFVMLPGGLGTLEAFTELVTWGQLGLHRKPCGILNANDFYAPLIQFYEHTVHEGFLSRRHRGMIVVERESQALLDRMKDYTAPDLPRWLDEQET